MHRFFFADLAAPVLAGAEAHHGTHVLRLKTGDELDVFDGRGNVARCQVTATGKHEIRLAVQARSQTPPLPVRITLAAAIIKKNFDFVVQKATELGVAELVPLVTERTIVRTGKSERWQDIALEACKQCGNNWLPAIHPPRTFANFIASPGHNQLQLIAALQPDARPLKQVVKPASTVLVVVGPEGDFTPAEYAAARAAGCVPVTLGPLTLRADTAALYALSIVHHELVNR